MGPRSGSRLGNLRRAGAENNRFAEEISTKQAARNYHEKAE